MIQFKKYNSIENSYQEKFIDSLYTHNFENEQFVVQEKVHGANLSFVTDGQTIKVAKRTSFIEKDDDFFNYKSVLTKYENAINELYIFLQQSHQIETLTIYGELFGGGYPHKQIHKNEEAKLVQQGIYYSAENDFYAFDILLDNITYLDVPTANELFERFGFIYAKTLYQGNLKECLTYANKFESTLPAQFGLPPLEQNICEGVIIKPIKPLFFKTGSRIIIKNKNENWSENNSKLSQDILEELLQTNRELSEIAQELLTEVSKYISENRLANVISKIGSITSQKQYGMVLGLFNKDILTDFKKEFNHQFFALEKAEQKEITKFVNQQAGIIVGNYFKTLR